jgi:hypothetical protein
MRLMSRMPGRVGLRGRARLYGGANDGDDSATEAGFEPYARKKLLHTAFCNAGFEAKDPRSSGPWKAEVQDNPINPSATASIPRLLLLPRAMLCMLFC